VRQIIGLLFVGVGYPVCHLKKLQNKKYALLCALDRIP
jgi:hypothetical protein